MPTHLENAGYFLSDQIKDIDPQDFGDQVGDVMIHWSVIIKVLDTPAPDHVQRESIWQEICWPLCLWVYLYRAADAQCRGINVTVLTVVVHATCYLCLQLLVSSNSQLPFFKGVQCLLCGHIYVLQSSQSQAVLQGISKQLRGPIDMSARNWCEGAHAWADRTSQS